MAVIVNKNELGTRLADQVADTVLNNLLNEFNLLVPNGSVVHWAASVKPRLVQLRAGIEARGSSEKTFAQLKSTDSNDGLWSATLEGIRSAIRLGAKV